MDVLFSGFHFCLNARVPAEPEEREGTLEFEGSEDGVK